MDFWLRNSDKSSLPLYALNNNVVETGRSRDILQDEVCLEQLIWITKGFVPRYRTSNINLDWMAARGWVWPTRTHTTYPVVIKHCDQSHHSHASVRPPWIFYTGVNLHVRFIIYPGWEFSTAKIESGDFYNSDQFMRWRPDVVNVDANESRLTHVYDAVKSLPPTRRSYRIWPLELHEAITSEARNATISTSRSHKVTLLVWKGWNAKVRMQPGCFSFCFMTAEKR